MVTIPEVSTPIYIEKLKVYLADHPDSQFVHKLIHGLQHGFHTGISTLPTQSFECKNLLSARRQPEVTEQLIQAEIDKGYLVGPFEEIPFPLYRLNPVGIAEGKYSKKKRLIVDLSAPHNDDSHVSLNELIDKDEY